MMFMPLTNYKVAYNERVYKAVALMHIGIAANVPDKQIVVEPKFLDVLVINEYGNLQIIRNEAWQFQFLPEVKRGGENE